MKKKSQNSGNTKKQSRFLKTYDHQQSFGIAKTLMKDFVENYISEKFLSHKSDLTITNKIYSVFFERVYLSDSSLIDLEIYLAFGLDCEMNKFCLGVWQKQPSDKPYEFWLKVCNDLREKGLEEMHLPNFDEHYWLREAMDKNFIYKEQLLSP
ncbi:MAG: transposase [Candidatus Caenarcaniphilales bacterium]|nr:transposase [Candidatus Caenarcaniphilales bacterium]